MNKPKKETKSVVESLSGEDSAKLRKLMKKGETEFRYAKKSNGEIRKAKGTLRSSVLPKYAEKKLPRRSKFDFTYFDLDKNDFRTFKRENFVGFGFGDDEEKKKEAEKEKPEPKKELTEAVKDEDLVLVCGISRKYAKKLLAHSRRDAENFKPEYVRKALAAGSSPNDVFGLFSRYDRKNALVLCTIVRNYGPTPDCAHLHEMTGFVKGGYGRKLVEELLKLFPKLWLQCAPDESDPENMKPNESLANGVYRKIPALKEFVVEKSIWNFPANFFCAGIPDEKIKKFLEEQFGI